jgi:hypothetical protein
MVSKALLLKAYGLKTSSLMLMVCTSLLLSFSRVFVLCADGCSGAVVLAMNSAVTIKNCYFVGNKALKLGRGSAIFGVNSNISIEHSVFSNHLSKGNGGTIHASRKSNVDILGSIFEGKMLCFEQHSCV